MSLFNIGYIVSTVSENGIKYPIFIKKTNDDAEALINLCHKSLPNVTYDIEACTLALEFNFTELKDVINDVIEMLAEDGHGTKKQAREKLINIKNKMKAEGEPWPTSFLEEIDFKDEHNDDKK